MSEDRVEIACALMLGAKFMRAPEVTAQERWTCFDEEPESNSPDRTGWWNFKANAARAYLSTKGVFFDREGNPITQ
jgi:hypothetical protein